MHGFGYCCGSASYLGGQVAQNTESVTSLQAQSLQGVWDHQALDLVIGGWGAVEHLQALQGSSTALGLVWHHPACMEHTGQVSLMSLPAASSSNTLPEANVLPALTAAAATAR